MIDCYGNVSFQISELVFSTLRVGWDAYSHVTLASLGSPHPSLPGEQRLQNHTGDLPCTTKITFIAFKQFEIWRNNSRQPA